ncbi:hypothetical protein [Flavobacterium foetidum]|uniref:hypothetical protein n=1 Tax=Flavobacterium foetidum TaxID=2026681 RepID=UPI001074B8A0|nr:hypothetical protein [Flavobacterium foetidum]KAF2516581.1 hypothetical protein E0W73_05680 [Flavobacterium foetidum]
MKSKISLLILFLFVISCGKKTETQTENANTEAKEVTIQKVAPETRETPNFDFENFKIEKGKVGDITIGMTMNEAESFLKNLSKTEAEAYDFGFDGGGKAYLYSFKDELVLALIPKRDSDEILAIAALNEKLRTTNGLHPKSSIQEIKKLYPKTQINQNLMMGWEVIYDEKNDWEFVFMTTEENRIGAYNDFETPAEPKIMNAKSDWITIK